MTPVATLRRTEVRAILQRHRGAIGKLAADLKINRVTLSEWLRGRTTSRRIEEAATARAVQLAASEAKGAK